MPSKEEGALFAFLWLTRSKETLILMQCVAMRLLHPKDLNDNKRLPRKHLNVK